MQAGSGALHAPETGMTHTLPTSAEGQVKSRGVMRPGTVGAALTGLAALKGTGMSCLWHM